MRKAETIIGELDLKWYKDTRKLKRNDLRMVTGSITGHCRLRGPLMKFGIEENGMCRFCVAEKETPIYLLTDCEALFRKRKKCFNTYCLTDRELNKVKPLAVLNFIKKTGFDVVLQEQAMA